jgi:hypothetical protein
MALREIPVLTDELVVGNGWKVGLGLESTVVGSFEVREDLCLEESSMNVLEVLVDVRSSLSKKTLVRSTRSCRG